MDTKIKQPIITQLLNPVFYCDDHSVGVEINGVKHEAPEAFYEMIDQERQNLKRTNKRLNIEIDILNNKLSALDEDKEAAIRNKVVLDAISKLIDSPGY